MTQLGSDIINATLGNAQTLLLVPASCRPTLTLTRAGDIDQVIGMLSDLGQSISRLTPEMKRQALQGLFAKKIIDTSGEIVRLEPQAWIAQAFGELVWAWRHTHQARNAGDIPKVTPTGLDAGIGISPQTAWLLERIAA